jgi:MFS family permease
MDAASAGIPVGYDAASRGYAQRWRALGASCLLAVALGTSPSVAALLTPTTPDVFGITSLTVQQTVNVVQLVFVAFVLFGGALGDLYGRRRFLLIGSAGFVLTGILTAAAPSQPLFVAGRALMGVFSALVLPLAVAVIRITFPPRELARPLGIYTAVYGLAQIGGPLLTQLFHNALSWRVAFVLPVLCGAAGGELVRRYVAESSAEGGRRRVEAVTTAAWAAMLLAVLFAISSVTAGKYTARYLLVGLAIAVVATLVLVVLSVQTRGDALGRKMPNKRALAVAIVAGVVLSLAVGGVLLQLTNFFTTIDRYGPVRMILAISPFGPGILVGGLLAGRLMGPLGARSLISGGLALMGLAVAGSSFITPTISYWWLILPFFLLGVGFNTANTCVLDTILSLVARDLAGAAAGVNEAVGRIGGAIGPLFTGTLLLQFGGLLFLSQLRAAGLSAAQIAQARDALDMMLRNTTPSNVSADVLQRLLAGYHAAYIAGLHAALLLVAAVCVVAAVFVWLAMPKHVAEPEK